MPVRECCVVKCNSKSPDKENNRTLFNFSADCKVWLDAIGNNLKRFRRCRKQFHICDLHFEGACMHQNDIKIVKDGAEVTMPRRRLSLRPNSIPSIFAGCADKSQKKLADRSPNLPSKTFSVSTQTCDSPTTFPVSTPPCDSPRTFPVSALVEEMDCSTNDDSKSGNNPSTGNAGTATLYTTTELLRDWTSLPTTDRIASWGVFPSNIGLLFMSCNVPVSDSSYATSRTLLVKMDMTVEIKARYRSVRFPALQRVTCLQDVLSAQKAISSLQVCEGPSCKNVLFERKSTARCNRCKVCQVKHRQEQDRERKRRKRESVRAARTLKRAKFMKNVKRKLTRAQMAVERYKADLQKMPS